MTLRRRRLAVFGSLLVVLLGIGYLGATGLAPVPASSAEVRQPDNLTQPTAQPTWPSFGQGAIGAVGFTGVLASHGNQAPVPIASITKMITALVVLEARPLAAGEAGPAITFTDADIDLYYKSLAENGSVAPVVSGMVLSQREAFEVMLLPSANNYAASLAVWAYGSESEYLRAANAWLQSTGLTETIVADTSGISSNSVSSPANLVDIAKLVVANPVLAEIVAMPQAVLPTIGVVTNTNRLLGRAGVDGIKTGTTDVAGACLLFSTELTVGTETVTVVGVVLGGNTHSELNDAVSALIGSVTGGFQNVNLVAKGDSFGSYTTAWGQSAEAVAAEDASVLVWSDAAITGVTTARTVSLGQAGDSVGVVSFAAGDQQVSVPLVLDAPLTDPGAGWRFSHPGELTAG